MRANEEKSLQQDVQYLVKRCSEGASHTIDLACTKELKVKASPHGLPSPKKRNSYIERRHRSLMEEGIRHLLGPRCSCYSGAHMQLAKHREGASEAACAGADEWHR
jgi:hypothetical protein